MILLTPDIRYALRANAMNGAAAQAQEKRFDPIPVVKFFNPLGAGTWLATELYADDDTLFGLADLGFGSPEMGVFSLTEVESVRLPYGLRIERDEGFHSAHRLSRWVDAARSAGSIIQAEQILNRRTPDAAPDLPTDPDRGAAG